MSVNRLPEQCWELLTDNGDPYEDIWEHQHYTSEQTAAEGLAAHQKDADEPTPGVVSMVEGYCVTVTCDDCGSPFDENDVGSPTHFAEANADDVRGYIGPEFTVVGEKDLCPDCALGTQGAVAP